MAANSTIRSRRCREHQANGLVRLAVLLDEQSVCQWLIDGEVLSPWETDDHQKIEQAFAHAVVLTMAKANSRSP